MPVLRNTDLDPGEWEEVYDAQVLGSRLINMKRIEEITSKHARLARPREARGSRRTRSSPPAKRSAPRRSSSSRAHLCTPAPAPARAHAPPTQPRPPAPTSAPPTHTCIRYPRTPACTPAHRTHPPATEEAPASGSAADGDSWPMILRGKPARLGNTIFLNAATVYFEGVACVTGSASHRFGQGRVLRALPEGWSPVCPAIFTCPAQSCSKSLCYHLGTCIHHRFTVATVRRFRVYRMIWGGLSFSTESFWRKNITMKSTNYLPTGSSV